MAPLPKLPGVLFVGGGGGELHSPALFFFEENGDRSWRVFLSPAPRDPSFLWPAQPKMWPWGRWEGRWEAQMKETVPRAEANTKCHFLFLILGHESSRGWVRALKLAGQWDGRKSLDSGPSWVVKGRVR